jgi:ABC-2 type transport system permease protein
MLTSFLRTFRPAAWLGWQIESNWTDPLMFFTFQILRPIASVLILVFMYRVVATTGTDHPLYAYIYLGNAFYIYVAAVMAGASYSLLDDRERYRMLKYLYIAPINIPAYMFGRGVARFIIGTLAVVVTLLAGALFFGVPLNPFTIDWPMFLAALALGILCLALMGIVIGGWTMTIRNEPWFIGDAVAAALYLFSGAIFPITILPPFLQWIGFALPLTYWLELIRRALLGTDSLAFPALAAFSNAQLFAILGGLTLAFGSIAFFSFRYFERVAREKGLLDAVSNF